MASTFVNDLRLEEMATGENSGSWGTKTNTNLELIAEAFSYGNEIIGDADTPITMADGASDAARSFFLKITSSTSLSTTRIVTLLPNTVSKVWMIENATSNGQIITIKQGSGATVNIANGQTKMIATDGGGTGAIVYDLMQDLAVPDLFVDDDLTVADDATIGGTLGVTGVVTANAGVVVDNITIDGNTISSTNTNGDLELTPNGTGNLKVNSDTLAVVAAEGEASAITLQADEADDNADIWRIASNTDNTFAIQNQISGSPVSHLTITPNATVANSTFAVAGGLTTGGTVTANAGVVVDNITIDGTEIDLSSGNLTLDVAGNIILDADAGICFLHDGGASYAELENVGGDFVIRVPTQDKDLILRGNDSGLNVDALTLDMSEAGAATFNSGITVGGDVEMSTHQIVFNNNSQAIQIRDAAGTASYVLYQDSADTLIIGNNTNVEKIRLDTSGNEGALAVDTNGNVGIGAT